jgi:hypothetical protein
MGRTVPTFRQLIEEAAARWTKFRRALRREDQEHFDRLFHRARCYTQAATYQCNDNPMEAILLSIALDQEKRLHALEQLAQPKENNHAIPGTVPTPTQWSIPEPNEEPIQRLAPRSLPDSAGHDPLADGPGAEPPPSD